MRMRGSTTATWLTVQCRAMPCAGDMRMPIKRATHLSSRQRRPLSKGAQHTPRARDKPAPATGRSDKRAAGCRRSVPAAGPLARPDA